MNSKHTFLGNSVSAAILLTPSPVIVLVVVAELMTIDGVITLVSIASSEKREKGIDELKETGRQQEKHSELCMANLIVGA